MIATLHTLLAKPARRIVGLMSGTSLDGIDAALVQVEGSGLATRVRLERFACTKYPALLQERLLAAASGTPLPSAEHARLDFEVGALFADAALGVARAACVQPRDIDLVASHGQTLFHHAPRGRGTWSADAATWQAGSVNVIAARCGIPVIGDFRSADVALGGTGAPLVPYVDFLLRRSPTENRVLLNVGGIANLTYLRAGGSADAVLAWDVGPGNMVMDALASALLGRERDEDGAGAERGRAVPELVEARLGGEYFSRPVPKSAGREQFGRRYVEELLRDGAAQKLQADDLLATAVEITARAVQLALQRPPLAGQPVDAVYIAGGGRHNRALVARLEALLAPAAVRGFESLGLDPDAKEAVDFAVLGNEAVHGYAANLTSVTGAARACILGSLALGGFEPRPLAS